MIGKKTPKMIVLMLIAVVVSFYLSIKSNPYPNDSFLYMILCGIACLGNDLARKGIDYRLGKGKTLNSSGKSNLEVVLIASNGSKVVSLGIEEHIIYKYLGGLNVGGLTGTELLIDFLECLVTIACAILLSKSNALVLHKGSLESLLITKHRDDSIIIILTGSGKRTDKHRDGKLAVLVNLNVEETRRIALILKPCSSVRNYGTATL